jgi:hypothetical protein
MDPAGLTGEAVAPDEMIDALGGFVQAIQAQVLRGRGGGL